MFEVLPDSSQSFYSMVMIQSIAALKLNTYLDNFDAERFNHDGVDRSREFNAGERAYYFDWFCRHHDRLHAAYSLLDGDASKRLYLFLLAYRLAGHFSVRLPVEFSADTPLEASYRAAERSRPSELAASGMFGKLRHYDFEFHGDRYRVDCLGLDHYLVRRQYFFDRDGVAIGPEHGDTVIDGGACTGETAAVFSNAVGPSGHVFCFDPVADHISILRHNAAQSPHSNITVLPCGISDTDIFAEPIVLNKYSPGFSSGGGQVPLRALDSLVQDGTIRAVGFLKLDVEGAELASLKGAVETLHRFKPKLAISLYHKPDDMFDLILHIKQHYPFYSLHLGHYTIHAEETVLYGHAKP